MAEKLNFVFLLVCIIILAIRIVIVGGQISKLEGKVDSLLLNFCHDCGADMRKEVQTVGQNGPGAAAE